MRIKMQKQILRVSWSFTVIFMNYYAREGAFKMFNKKTKLISLIDEQKYLKKLEILRILPLCRSKVILILKL